MREAMELLLEGAVADDEIIAFLSALKTRGETVEEIIAAAEAMRSRALKISAPEGAIDTCGTGGDGAETLNISTAAALIAAGAGAFVAKHGNRAASSRCGSSDVLAALGVNLAAPAPAIERAIREAHVGFMFAAYHHKAVARVAEARRRMKTRTLFNLLGPLSNPAGARRQLMGVYDAALARPLAEALMGLGAAHVWVVHGEGGLDEISLSGPTLVIEARGGAVREFTVTPEDAGLARAGLDAIKGGDAETNAAAIRALLDGAPSAFRDVAILNAAAALIVAGRAGDLREGARLGAEAIESGAAAHALARLVAISNEAA
jgi:anthranilate phosphoribosyltransferase